MMRHACMVNGFDDLKFEFDGLDAVEQIKVRGLPPAGNVLRRCPSHLDLLECQPV